MKSVSRIFTGALWASFFVWVIPDKSIADYCASVLLMSWICDPFVLEMFEELKRKLAKNNK